MAKIQVTFRDEREALLDERVEQLRRPSRSFHCAQLIDDDLRAAGLLPAAAPAAELAELHSQLAAHLAALSPVEAARFRASLANLMRADARRARAA